ncbi:MAG TPA: YhcN/YlaJ family sporulation lipoprotein [Pseudogracilibacillus sp.]|nr:YhcN/YlaJ family sporulation lipoprotein [Pseudogracilibacillus sp.]
MRLKALVVMFTAFVLLMGCSSGMNDNKPKDNKGTNTQTENTKFENTQYKEGDRTRLNRDDLDDRDRHSNNRNSNNRQDEYDVSKEAADRIVDEVAEIERAYVLTTKNNAYVAAELDKGTASAGDNLAKNDRQNSSAGMNIRNVNDRNAKSRVVNEGDSNERRTDNHMSNRRDIDTDRYNDDRQVESDEVTDQVKNKIADIVQDVDDNIDNVYVSTSPDFFDLAHNYSSDMDNGKPVRGFFDQIGNTIERIFPQNKR